MLKEERFSVGAGRPYALGFTVILDPTSCSTGLINSDRSTRLAASIDR